jgi:peptide/nickel transport system substrate-binding protein
MKKSNLSLFYGSMIGLLLVGCRGPQPGPAASSNAPPPSAPPSTQNAEEPPSVPGKYGGTLTAATISDPKSLNLWVAAETSTTGVVGPLFEPLNRLNDYTLKYESRLADLPQISPDGLVYTYRLKDGLKWSDGQPIDADDVLFTLNVIFDPKIDTNMRESMRVDVTKPDGTVSREPFKYRKIDARTVEFRLPAKYAPAQSIFSFPIAPRHKLEAAYKAGKFNSTWGVNTPVSELVSDGPFMLAEYVPGQRVVFKRNPYFWKKSAEGKPLPYLDQMVILIVPDLNTGFLKFQSGETDVLSVPPPNYPAVKKGEANGDYRVINAGPTWGIQYLSFNQNPGAKLDKNLLSLFQDVRFRQAVSCAVDRRRIVDDVFLGLAQPLYGPVSPADKNFYNPNLPKFDYNLDKSKALLKEIGLKDSDGDGYLEYRGKEVQFNILTVAGNELAISVATILTDDLKKVGLHALFTPVQFNDLVRRLDAKPYDWEAHLLGFTGGPEPNDGSNIWRSSGNLHLWNPYQKTPATAWEARIDRLFRQGAEETDPAKRKAIYDQWQNIMGEEQPLIFTAVGDVVIAIRKRFGNVKPTSLGGTRWNIEEMYDTNATRSSP